VIHNSTRKWHVHPKQGWVSFALVFVSPANTEVKLHTLIRPFSCSKDRLGGGSLRTGSEGGKIKAALLFRKALLFKAICNVPVTIDKAFI